MVTGGRLLPGRKHLVNGLGEESFNDLRRLCERGGRRAATPLFWTFAAGQVGNGAIIRWREMLAPALQDMIALKIWPFQGLLADLVAPGKIVVAETYPSKVGAARALFL